MTPADAFRQLREQWFDSQLRITAQPFEWESDPAEELRDRNNDAMKKRFDADTEAILRGEDRPISPRCSAELFA